MSNEPFVAKWVFNSRNGSLNREIDKVRSRYPSNLASGRYYWSNSQVFTAILSVPSAARFILEKVIINNGEGGANYIRFYDGSTLAYTAFGVPVGASQGVFLGPNEVEGLVFESGVYASNLDSYIEVRVSGYLIMSSEYV